MAKDNSSSKDISANRLRVGVVFFVLFWIPFWLLSPALNALLGDENNKTAEHRVYIAVIIIQTIFGIIGIILAGKPVAMIIRHTKYKKAPKVIWRLFRTGSIDSEKV